MSQVGKIYTWEMKNLQLAATMNKMLSSTQQRGNAQQHSNPQQIWQYWAIRGNVQQNVAALRNSQLFMIMATYGFLYRV